MDSVTCVETAPGCRPKKVLLGAGNRTLTLKEIWSLCVGHMERLLAQKQITKKVKNNA